MSSSWAGHGPSAPAPVAASSSDSKNKKPAASRQLLSCTKCRERKVKCDRTKPCSACCGRGQPSQCEFVVGEGNDYSPIPQSYEIRKLRVENQKLKEKLAAAGLQVSGDEDEDETSGGSRAAATRQRRFKTHDRFDNLYFGTPGLATIVHELASLHMGGAQSLTHPMPKGKDMYAPEETTYPFPVITKFCDTAQLLELLPEREDLFACLDLFQRRAQACSFPHMPDEVTKREVERFLSDRERNAELFPDMLALIFATLATGLQMGQYDRNGAKWTEKSTEDNREVYVTASMQALRNGSFMSRPTLLGLQTLIMMGPYLTNSGRFLDAWTLFGTTIRLAHSIGVHRHPSLLDPTPSLRESQIRTTLWWWMLHMDQQYSITLGRPLGISGMGDCPQPEISTTNTTMLRLNKFMDEYTILARQVLSSTDMANIQRIDEFTDKLINLWETMPEALQFNESWLQITTQLPEWPLETLSASLYAKVQSLLILLNRQRIERAQAEGSPDMQYNVLGILESNARRLPYRGRPLVVNSSFSILQTLMFFYHRNKAVLICWTMVQQAFNAAMILLLDWWETDNNANEWIINQAYGVFQELNEHGVHKLAELAVKRIFAAMQQIRERQQQRESMSRRVSDFAHPPATMSPDTAPMLDFGGDTVMGSAGMFLLEDTGLQFSSGPQYPTLRPWGWDVMSGDNSAHPSCPSGPPTPNVPSPIIPVSQISAATFPVMSTAHAIGLQPRMGPSRRSTAPVPNYGWPTSDDAMFQAQANFTSINATNPMPPPQQQQQQEWMQQLQHPPYQQLQYQPQPQQSYHSHPQPAIPPRTSSRQPHGVPYGLPHVPPQGNQQQQQQQQGQSFSHLRGPRHSHALTPTQHSQAQQASHEASHGQEQSRGAGTGGRPRTHHRLERPGQAGVRRSTQKRSK